MKYIWVFAGLLSLVVTGCTADLQVPSSIVLACETSSDCPGDAVCQETDDGAASVCITNGESSCGNGVKETGEFCDDGSNMLDDYQLIQTCLNDCSGYGSYCR